MGVSIIRGTNDKPAASGELASAMAGCSDFSGQLFIGYPIVSTPEGRHRIDALLVSPDLGLVVFDLVEGTAPGDYGARQDDSANKLEARLKTHSALMRRRDLRVPVHTLSFAPAVREPDVGADPDYPLAGRATLPHALRRFIWDEPDQSVYEAALSAIENVSSIRKSRKQRSAVRPDSRGARLEKLESSIATLDATQGRAVIETVDGVQRIRGLAGSGKTIVLALKAAYLHAQHPEWRIAVTFQHPLAQQPVAKSAPPGSTRRLSCYTLAGMAMGTTRDDGSQQSMWVSAADLPQGGGHPFYELLNRIFEAAGFDAFVEGVCARFYATKTGRPNLAPGRCFRLLLIGYFEGPDSERAIAWRAADSLSVRTFLRLALPGVAAGPFDDLADAASVFGRGSSGGLRVGAGAVGGVGAGFGEDAGHRRDDAGGERGDAEHRGIETPMAEDVRGRRTCTPFVDLSSVTGSRRKNPRKGVQVRRPRADT